MADSFGDEPSDDEATKTRAQHISEPTGLFRELAEVLLNTRLQEQQLCYPFVHRFAPPSWGVC